MASNLKEDVVRKVRRLYFLSMSTIVAVSMVIYVITSYNINAKSGIGDIINIAGSQRMLCQRAVLFLSFYDQTLLPEHKQTAEEAINQLKKQHESLLYPPGELNLKHIRTDDLQKLYAERGLDERVNRFIAVVNRALTTKDSIERKRLTKGLGIEVKNRLLSELDEAVNIYTSVSAEKIDNLNRIINLFIVVIFLIVAGNILFVYKPVNNQINDMLQ